MREVDADARDLFDEAPLGERVEGAHEGVGPGGDEQRGAAVPNQHRRRGRGRERSHPRPRHGRDSGDEPPPRRPRRGRGELGRGEGAREQQGGRGGGVRERAARPSRRHEVETRSLERSGHTRAGGKQICRGARARLLLSVAWMRRAGHGVYLATGAAALASGPWPGEDGSLSY